MKWRIRGGRVIDPVNGCDETLDLWIDGDTIAATGRRPAGFEARREIDARGLQVWPGLVELNARLREPGAEHKATIASELAAAARGGFTTVCCMPDTDPVIDTPAVVELIYQRARNVRGARVRCIGALTRDLGGEVLAEMHALRTIGCVGVTNARHAIRDSGVLLNALDYAATLGLTVFLQSEDPWLAAGGVMHEGAASTRAGLVGIPPEAELVGLARDLLLVEKSGVRAHFSGLSTARSVAALKAARRRGATISADVGMPHLHLVDSDIDNDDARFHLRPPLRAAADRRGLGRALADGGIDAVSAQHEPHDQDAKAAPFAASEPGASGFDTFVPLLLELVARGTLDLARAVASASVAPAAIIGLPPPALSAGCVADITLVDPAKIWTATDDAFASAGRNSPFHGRRLSGRAVLTAVGGRIVFEDGLA